jgi:hypothetical protein
VCASWYRNKEKRDQTEVPDFLFYEGKVTKLFFEQGQILTDMQVEDLERLAILHYFAT